MPISSQRGPNMGLPHRTQYWLFIGTPYWLFVGNEMRTYEQPILTRPWVANVGPTWATPTLATPDWDTRKPHIAQATL